LTTKSSERRSFLEIVASILDACEYETRKTHVMYQCNLSFKQFTGYLDLLLEANLLLIDNDRRYDDRRCFLLRVSSKGIDFLKAYNGMKSLMELP
jgi:predicted transcriptional regulator